jgi:hypothetical protein
MHKRKKTQGTKKYILQRIFLKVKILVFNINKQSLNKNLFIRYNITDLGVSLETYIPPVNTGYPKTTFGTGMQLQVGIEKRRELSSKSHFFYGFDVIGGTSFSRINIDNPTLPERKRDTDFLTIKTGLGAPVGYIINIHNNLFFSFEIEPELTYSYRTYGEASANYKHHIFDFDIDKLKISLIHKWGK